ncbi:hypothetical protein BH11PSE5_BH11PSE5_28420 [soil metagenome]|uniref:DUF6414 family protein n=1 Tax=Sphingobium sp. BS19 TaxID=3018973 RepID=UPI0022EDE2C0|nr:hypothetical protein [Sphingobium sp. BS19]GLI97462.1 hypothetical protein Sbs19_12800 [Sphingobium sp. BS19]|tara:strand:+ start:976 stop:1785 length:810 start_codon:yes stop_codon:yes gene_type:complete
MEEDLIETASVYDFLYVDHDRIGLLLSQFSSDGVLTEIVRESAEGTGANRAIDIKIVKVGSSESGSTALNRRFNARWLVPLLFLDQAKELLKRDISEADLGNLVLATGTLCLLNTDTLQTLYKSPNLQKIAMRKANDNAKEAKETFNRETAQVELDAMASMEPQVQMHLFRSDAPRLWATLRPDGLIMPPAELNMKYGNLIDGNWNVVGILDAHTGLHSSETLEALSGRFEGQIFLQEAIALGHGLRTTYGRPADAYGMTPLLVFRAIA